MNDYEAFYGLHRQAKPLLLANAWNAKSAQIIEQSGYAAVATSSGAVAASLGYADGEKIPFGELLYMIKRIKASISLPLTVDMERGYTNDLKELTNNLQQLIDVGVSGINLEDAQGEEIYLKKLEAIKNYLAKTNQQLFVNARTDAFLQKLDAPLETTLRRAKIYAEAGADGLFVTAVQSIDMIKKIVSATSLPVNIVSNPNLSISDLTAVGVKRISMAVLLFKAACNHLESLAKGVLENKTMVGLFGKV